MTIILFLTIELGILIPMEEVGMYNKSPNDKSCSYKHPKLLNAYLIYALQISI